MKLLPWIPSWLLTTIWAFLPLLIWAQAQQAAPPPISTGIAVGQKTPPFRLMDQSGRMQDFSSIRGPNGAALFFNRSADW
ncbi:MAG: hypothetical protein A3H94_05430 [Acidobacteria bacterium RIFCSPLOWO2_02_FULL_60_20]|nr:MAG: hypothetical protein A3H94_05430 [Acidobacteria bacterium RIFCSPLOWO2_02_FULL_60_20]